MELKDYKPGQVVSLPGFILHSIYGNATWCSSELNSQGYTTICPHELTFVIPLDFNAVKAEVGSIDKAMQEAADSYHSTMANLRERKNNLLQLTFNNDEPEVVEAAFDIAPANLKDIDDDIPF